MWSVALLAALGIALFAGPAHAEDGDELGAPPAATDAPVVDDFPMDVRDDVFVDYGPPPVPRPGPAPSFRRVRAWDITVGASLTLYEYPSGIIGLRVPPTTATPYRWSENDPGAAFGYHGTVGYNYSPRNRLEARGGWRGEYDASTPQLNRQIAFTAVPGGPTTLTPLSSTTLRTHTEIWEVEGNWWRTVSCQPCSIIDVGLGVRYLSIEELATTVAWSGLPATLQSQVDNKYIFAQLMGGWHWRPDPRIEVGVTGKGLLGYHMRDMQESDSFIIGPGATPNQTRGIDEFSWGAEGEVSVTYRFTPGFAMVGRYTLLYLDAVSRAENILDFSRTATGSIQIGDLTETTILNIFYVGFRFDL